MAAPIYILNHKAVVDFFGCWPSFHDAKVCAYEPTTSDHPVLSFTLHTWQMTDQVDSKGFFILRNHALVTFRFSGLYDVNMNSFTSDNILFGAKFIPASGSDSFRVELDSVMDMSGSFSARAGEVVTVIPCGSNGAKP